MSERGDPEARVGVRELRQNLSVYLRRVKSGETLEVTEYGQIVARLAPAPSDQLSPYERMVAEGHVIVGTGDFLAVEPLDLGPGPSLLGILLEMREEDDR